MKNLIILLTLSFVFMGLGGSGENYKLRSNNEIELQPATEVIVDGALRLLTENPIQLEDAAGGQNISIKAPTTVPSNYVLELPDTDGNADQMLRTDGLGVLIWKDIFIATNDNRLLRTTNTDDVEIQESGITVDDSDNITGVNDISVVSIANNAIGKFLIDDATQTVTNKTINGGIINGQTASTSNVLTPPSETKANLDTLCPSLTAGSLVYATDQTKYYLCDGATLTELGSGAGGGLGINYIENFGAEDDLAGWATYDDGVVSVPVDGTGGSPSNLLTRVVTATALRGQAHFSYQKLSSTQGEGFSYDFTIDNADKSQILGISFDYDLSAALVTDTDFRVYVFNRDSSIMTEINPRDIPAGKGRFEGYFQTHPDDDDYRFIIHTVTNISAYTIYLDTFQVGPLVPAVKSGTVILSAYGSATQNENTTSGVKVAFDSTSIDTTGSFDPVNNWFVAPESGDYFISANLQIRVDDLANRRTYTRIMKNGSTAHFYSQTLDATASTDAGLTITKILPLIKGDEIYIQFQSLDDPTWSISHAINSSSFDVFKINSDGVSGSGRFVGAKVVQTSPQSVGFATNTTIDYDSKLWDTTNSFDLALDRFTAPESGHYQHCGTFLTDNVAWLAGERTSFELYLQGAFVGRLYFEEIDTSDNLLSIKHGNGCATIYMEKGQYSDVKFYHSRSGGNTALNGNNTDNFLTIEKVDSPSTVSGKSPAVYAVYKDLSAQAVGTSATQLSYTTPWGGDSHGAWDGDSFRCPISGLYEVNASFLTDGESWLQNQAIIMAIDVSGAGTKKQHKIPITNTVATNIAMQAHVQADVWCNKDQEIIIYGSSTIATNTNPSVSGVYNVVSIKKVD